MEPHQHLEVFLPKLCEGLRREGIAEDAIAGYVFQVRTRKKPRPLKTEWEYLNAWRACHVAMEILTDNDDGSEAADWLNALTHRVFDYEDAFEDRHRRRPLNPDGPEWTDGPTGNA